LTRPEIGELRWSTGVPNPIWALFDAHGEQKGELVAECVDRGWIRA
jgi:hypothetical protein